MILYVNGDSNSNGAELTDSALSWPQLLATRLGCTLVSDAKDGASNDKIIRLSSNALSRADKNTVAVIGWTGWEREEWEHQGKFYDVNSGGHDILPTELQERYKVWVANQNPDSQSAKSLKMHNQIHRMHRSLNDQRISHLFFNALMPFQHNLLDPVHKDWGKNYLGPYDNDLSYYWYLKNQGFKPTKNNHHTEKAQEVWADVLYTQIQEMLL